MKPRGRPKKTPEQHMCFDAEEITYAELKELVLQIYERLSSLDEKEYPRTVRLCREILGR